MSQYVSNTVQSMMNKSELVQVSHIYHAALFMSVHVWNMSEHAYKHVSSLLPFCLFECNAPLIINYFTECCNTTIYSSLSLGGHFPEEYLKID